jgi:pimeloyl-ACP methyl ester carboxylesterase
MLLLSVLCSVAARAQEPADWIEFPGASAELVPEAVFGGRVMLYQAGRRGAQVPGQVVVLVHGLSEGGARDWSKLIPALAVRYQVFALDLPGFGQSDKGNHLYSPDNYARVIEQVIAPRVSAPFTLVGHSLGGAVSLAYVAAYPQHVARLVLVDVAGVLQRTVYSEFLARVGGQRAMGIELPWFDSVVRAIQLRAETVPMRADLILRHPAVRQRLLRGKPNAIAALALIEHDFSQGLRAITAPTRVIWGADDPVSPLRTGQALASAIRGARLTVMEGAGHDPQQQFPQRFNPIVLDELDGREVAAPPYLLPRGTIPDGRVGRCAGQRAQEFSGDYERIELEHCADASIADARVGTLRAANSAVRVVNSHIRDGIDALNSRLELNGGSVGGSVVLDAASVDAAGVRFEPISTLGTNKGSVPAVLRFSVSEVSTGDRAPRYLHEIIRLAPGEALIR